ncbi:D-TA family PLP-dependent enzyme [Dyadobacter helix]|nr:D-TA family PLP-dependent enzyme [Dyadobacter sp. CECT 9275]
MWYQLKHPEKVISPSLLFYKDRIQSNISSMVNMAGHADRLVPHVKTHKTKELIGFQLEKNITRFKCATIAEAEMVASAGGKWILLAYQMVGPNIGRLFQLKNLYPDVSFSSLIDNQFSADDLNAHSLAENIISSVFIDVNNGMNRSGHATDTDLLSLYRHINTLPNLKLTGIHIYDGHIRNAGFAERKVVSELAYETVYPLLDLAKQDGGDDIMIIVGGSPTFNVHAQREGVYLSPGTNVLWDWGYGDRFQDQPFLQAALVITRVISKPTTGIVTIDLGHKAVSAENPIENRFKILNLAEYTLASQSEEHGVLQVSEEVWNKVQIGDVFYAVPYHVCPTVALHDYASVIEDGEVTEEWKIVARNRRITV